MDTRTHSTSASTGSATMRAVSHDRFGDPTRVLHVAEVPVPRPGPDEVLVQVQAAGVDQGVWHLVAGLPYPVRLAGYGVRTPKNPVPGADVAGVVVEVGSDVAHLQVGDGVLGLATGAFAPYARARADLLVARPAGIDPVHAAAVPTSGLTALQAVRDHGHVTTGQRVLVLGAAGGVGSFAAQIARSLGATVTGTSRTAKLEAVRSLGIDDVVDHSAGPLSELGRTWDVIIDTGGQRSLRELRRLLAHDGTLVIVGSETGGRWLGGTDRQIRAMVLSRFVRQSLGTFISSENGTDLATLAGLVADGTVRPLLDRTFPLEDAAAAIDHLRQGRAAGKVVLTTDAS